jgi:ABC-type transport system involved in multi-copper enzyme maturation permease subunit
MIGRVWAIALNTFREATRSRVIYGILALVVGVFFLAIVLGEMSLHEEARVARDIGLAAISFFGSITAIILGVALLYQEVQRRTIHTIVSKPLERYEFVLGKYVGMSLTLSVLVLLFSLGLAGLLAVQGVGFTSSIAKAITLTYFEVLVVAAIAVFFSAFASPYLSGVFTFGLFFLGRVTPEMRAAVETSKVEWIRDVCSAALAILPDLHMFSISGGTVNGEYVSVHGDFVSWGYVLTTSMYGMLYITILLTLAILIFSRRDLA